MNRYQDFKLKSQLDPPLPDDTIIELEKELSSLKKQNEIMRKALEFYAKEVQKDHWPDGAFKEEFYTESPLGRRARQALAEIGEVKE